MFFWGKT